LFITSATAAIVVDTVSVSDVGNAPDTTGLGSVDYDYEIATHEVTNEEYTAFLNAVAATDTYDLYNPSMGSSNRGGILRTGTSGSWVYSTKTNFDNKPVNFVSFWDAARFANWLTNGQGSADTETGVYDLGGNSVPVNASVTRDTSFGFGSLPEVWAVASEDEWYKAAHYDGSGSYFDYPTQSNTAPTQATASGTGDISNPGSNVANYNRGAVWNLAIGNVTTVGSAGAGSASHYGTFDQGGNVFEWNDTVVATNRRGMRGGSFLFSVSNLESTFNTGGFDPIQEDEDKGFRVSNFAPIPEPSAYAAILGFLGLTLALTRRRRRGTL
jgi:formylglycine-generating enzyme required for sulfatase activity